MNGLRGVFGLQEEKLSDNDVGGVVVDRSVDADDSLLEKPREYVVRSLPSRRVLDHHRYQTERTS